MDRITKLRQLTVTHPVNLRDIQKCGTTFVGYGGITVTTQRASYGHQPEAAVLAGIATAIEVTATSDGRGYVAEWHDENVDGAFADSVYVERYSPMGREFHGFIDSVSRKLVQTG